jgi:hypothetical protein
MAGLGEAEVEGVGIDYDCKLADCVNQHVPAPSSSSAPFQHVLDIPQAEKARAMHAFSHRHAHSRVPVHRLADGENQHILPTHTLLQTACQCLYFKVPKLSIFKQACVQVYVQTASISPGQRRPLLPGGARRIWGGTGRAHGLRIGLALTFALLSSVGEISMCQSWACALTCCSSSFTLP